MGEQLTIIDRPVSEYVANIVAKIQEGNIDPLDVIANFRKIEKVIDGVMKTPGILDSMMAEYDKYGQKEVEYNGVVLSKVESGVKYDYSNCGDPEYNLLIAKQKEIENDIKERKKFLDGIPESGTTILDEETGEVVKLMPRTKTSTTILKSKVL